MSVRVRLPALFADRINGVSAVDLSATTVDGTLRALSERYPQLETLVFDAAGEINPVMVLFLNDDQLSPEQWHSAVSPGDEIQIIPAIEGG